MWNFGELTFYVKSGTFAKKILEHGLYIEKSWFCEYVLHTGLKSMNNLNGNLREKRSYCKVTLPTLSLCLMRGALIVWNERRFHQYFSGYSFKRVLKIYAITSFSDASLFSRFKLSYKAKRRPNFKTIFLIRYIPVTLVDHPFH